MNLCEKNVIFHIHHRYYSDLTHKGSISNILEEHDKNDLLEWIPRKDWNSQDH